MIDSHCHLADEAFVPDLKEVVKRAQAAGLIGALCILDATNRLDRQRAKLIRASWPEVRFATGIHPHQAGTFSDTVYDVESTVRKALTGKPDFCAIGEIGLDYHYDFAPRTIQQEVFARQIRLARDESWPVVIHTREADDDTLRILKQEGRGAVRGVFHCFTGNRTLARKALDLGFHISFSGIVTFMRADEVREVAKLIPDDRLLAETDAPYLAPTPYRGKRNEPAWVVRVLEVLGEIRSKPVDEVSRATVSAFKSLFGLAAKGLLR